MKVFISWSGERSRKAARILKDWLPTVIQSLETAMSEDIEKGSNWLKDLDNSIKNSALGILIITRENLKAPWLLFEAGALWMRGEQASVRPFLLDVNASELEGPLKQFQSTVFDREDIRRLVKEINRDCGANRLPEERLNRSFD